MNLKDKLKTLFTEMAADSAPSNAPMPPTEYKQYALKDGTKVAADKLEAGGMLVLVSASGDQTPAPAGEYTLADDTIVTLSEVGKIESVTMPGEPKQGAATDANTVVMQQLSVQLSEQAARVAKADQRFAEQSKLIITLQEHNTKLTKQLSTLADVVKEMLETPAADTLQVQLSQQDGKPSKAGKLERMLSKIDASNQPA